MRGVATVPDYVVMQPTTLCNLDCSYCYLPLRSANRQMPRTVAAAVAETVNGWAAQRRFSVVWHGGEPLALGRDKFATLLGPFDAAVEQHVQTNATMIDDAWCEFFAAHRMRVSVSVDGPRARNDERRARGGRPAYDQIVRGVDALRRHDIAFSALCVVSDPQPGLAAELYEFFLTLGCDVLGINIEETEGVNVRSNGWAADAVAGFWAELVGAWRRAPRIHLREVEWTLRYVAAELDGTADEVLPRRLDPIPTIAYDGSVVLLSPELAGFTDSRYGDFTSGNVLTTGLAQILAAAEQPGWITEFVAGVEACRQVCPYFRFCGGGHAANRYFEHGRFDGTETNHCRNSKIHLLEGVLAHARDQQSSTP
ncbi:MULTISPECIES: cyclophane-forming radical SAM peptide maturase AmcB [unclassified Solwaraspora]|uniref:cyclophane-forming radical SAM peptide maturase AmcB n=1 Tax=unclassified Solwaraspora TaxID=2627926 RepID=UPI00259B5521|nr:cyclophane-forming radical SAM peptide maturase AmcB [Solwaraspora sp. WMMA2056]WJK43818.1 cyclophane-forming radical SAM peptide maturase AmcB [Solwaraspora sp. WMMA2056]